MPFAHQTALPAWARHRYIGHRFHIEGIATYAVINAIFFLVATALVLVSVPLWLIELGLAWKAGTLSRPKFCFPKECEFGLDWLFWRRAGLKPGTKHMVRLMGVQFHYA